MQKLINVMQNCCIYIDDLNYVKANLTIRFTLLTLRQSEGTQMGAFFRGRKRENKRPYFCKSKN